MTDRVDIAEPLKELCERLRLPYNYVRSLRVTPSEVEAELFEGRDGRGKGAKHIDLDTGEPAIEKVEIKVKTW